MLLGADSSSLGEGGHHRLMLVLGIKQRLSTRVAIRIAGARARLMALPATSPVSDAVQGALAVTGRNWLTDSLTVMASIGIEQDMAFENFQPAVALMRSLGRSGAKQAVLVWKKHVLLPAARRADAEWFQKEVSRHWAPPASGQAMEPFLTCNWGKIMWRYTRAWLLARAGAGSLAPFASLGRPDIARLQLCPLCREVATLQHYLGACATLLHEVGPPPVEWPTVLNPAAADIEDCIRWVGRCLTTVILQQP